MQLFFEWDEEKAERNLLKHGITFDEAASVLRNPLSVTIADPLHSVVEQRYLDIGRSEKGRVLVVAYTERGNAIRLISARKATRGERKQHEEKDN